jgi:hypothetical protein
MGQLSPAAVRTLVGVAEVLEAAQDDWWLIGGAAVALQGLAIEIADADVLLSARDARQVIATLNIRLKEGVAIDRVRSDIWARWTALPLGVDLMAGLQIRTGDHWTRVEPATREAVAVEGRAIYVPSRVELGAICRLFGRPKDLERAEGLARIG